MSVGCFEIIHLTSHQSARFSPLFRRLGHLCSFIAAHFCLTDSNTQSNHSTASTVILHAKQLVQTFTPLLNITSRQSTKHFTAQSSTQTLGLCVPISKTWFVILVHFFVNGLFMLKENSSRNQHSLFIQHHVIPKPQADFFFVHVAHQRLTL